jgi:hypothetical protein
VAATDVLTLDEARDALRFATGDTTRDDPLATVYVPAVTSVVEDVVGPVVRRTVTHTAEGGQGAVLLPTAASSVTSVVEDGTTLTAGTDYVTSPTAGVIYRGSSTGRTSFGGGVGSVVVTYVAGVCDTTDDVPANIKLAARLILAATWQKDQQGGRPEFGTTGDGATVMTPSGHAIPRDAYSYLEPSSGTMPGFA